MADVLDELLGRMQVEGSWYAGLRAGAPWAVSFVKAPVARLVVIAAGRSILTSPDIAAPMELSAGDCLIVKAGVGFTLQDQLGRPAINCESVFSSVPGLEAVAGGAGEVTEIRSGRFTYDLTAAEPLTHLLPPVYRIRLDEANGAAINATLNLISAESATGAIGAGSIIDSLADVLFLQALRAWCTSADGSRVGWVAALRVPPLAAAMRAMHTDLAKQWTVAELAREASMSRSGFAALFKQVAGESPLSYLTRLRINRAKMLLRETPSVLGDIAVAVGYESDTALSRAFRKYESVPPGVWRQTHRQSR